MADSWLRDPIPIAPEAPSVAVPVVGTVADPVRGIVTLFNSVPR